MINVCVMYQKQDGKHFNWEYYTRKHVPRTTLLLGAHAGFKGVSIERGLTRMPPGTPVHFEAVFRVCFESLEAFEEAFVPHASEIRGDMVNYTNIEPIIQINTIVAEA